MSGSGDPRVDFLVAGVQKGGTTALFDHLRAFPSLVLPAEKELHFFDDDTGVNWGDPDYSAYHARFPARPGVKGEATPIYLYWPNCLERIADYRPGMKFIILLRDPIERAWSHWKMETARGADYAPFAWAIRDGRARVACDEAALSGHHRVFSYVERGFYDAQLARIYALFPAEQILLLRSEHLRDMPHETLSNVASFLGIPMVDDAATPRRVHVGPSEGFADGMTEADRCLLRKIYAADRAALAHRTRWDFSGWV